MMMISFKKRTNLKYKKIYLRLVLITVFIFSFHNNNFVKAAVVEEQQIVELAKGTQGQSTKEDDYLIAPEDVLDINVWKDDNLTKVATVDKDGFITLPYLNKVKAAGLTTKELANFMAEKLKSDKYLLEPKVTVSVKEYRGQKVMVFGMVRKPGMHFLKGKTYVLDFLSQIESTEGTGGKMLITRKLPSGKEETIDVDLYTLLMDGDLSQNTQILDGDSIIVSRKSTKQQIYILGEVGNPGPYTIERDLTVLEALRMAGGLTAFANKGKVKIIREEKGKKKNIIVNLNRIQKGDKAADITLQAGDVLVGLKSWF